MYHYRTVCSLPNDSLCIRNLRTNSKQTQIWLEPLVRLSLPNMLGKRGNQDLNIFERYGLKIPLDKKMTIDGGSTSSSN